MATLSTNPATAITRDFARSVDHPSFVYRGVAYQPSKLRQERVPSDLMYRGFPHDGMARIAPNLPGCQMIYRGVTYVTV
ncbi:DUF4278 domain-containing protein [Roseovarius aestuariivivens]|uniref:DUF4278 domain-containing protein n=1 Tax=Roseovarius aestuariivivens TaxID=1888910 RepID=UPI003CC9AF29